MISKQVLLQPIEPWVARVEGEADKVAQKIKVLLSENEGACLFVMNGREMKNLNGLYDELAEVLKFPDYFGRNFNALDEGLCELDWLDFSTCVLLIKEGHMILEDESTDIFDGLIEIFENAGEEWSKPIELGEDWDRSAIPFHVVLQSTTSMVSDKLKNFPCLGFS